MVAQKSEEPLAQMYEMQCDECGRGIIYEAGYHISVPSGKVYRSY
ncbi:MAG: hypothetical protein ACFE9D_01200 [Promethearchaeota archaeon]